MLTAGLDTVRRIIRDARSITVLTGAGISAESGIPTFRSAGGFWQGQRAEDLATPEGFLRDPKMVWEWYDWRRSQIAETNPNPGHAALVQLQQITPEFTLITQNVDGLHERAGSRSTLRLHGSIWNIRCMKCQREVEDLSPRLPMLPPVCDSCGGMMRPGVVWFGQDLPAGVFERATDAAVKADVFLVVGTSAVVYPAAMLVPFAKQAGATVVEINPEETSVSDTVHHVLRGPSGVILPRILPGELSRPNRD